MPYKLIAKDTVFPKNYSAFQYRIYVLESRLYLGYYLLETPKYKRKYLKPRNTKHEIELLNQILWGGLNLDLDSDSYHIIKDYVNRHEVANSI